MVKERPILFSGPMVRAILEGRKTETRRIVKPQPVFDSSRESWQWEARHGTMRWSGPRPQAAALIGFREQCPFGRVGDRLWVREAFAFTRFYTDPESGYVDDVEYYRGPLPAPGGTHLIFRELGLPSDEDEGHFWRPSIYMPRWASRITLEVVSVRVERLHDITEASALAEGVRCRTCGGPVDGSSENECECFHNLGSAIPSFASLWESINGEGSWGANPWVWVVQFQRVQP